MLKKIKVNDLRLGMYIQEVCGSWMDHPFWKSSFMLTEDKHLNTVKNCGVNEVWIDTSKGLDIDADVAALSQKEAESKVENELKKIELTLQRTEAPVPLQVELIAAKKYIPKPRRLLSPCLAMRAWVTRSNLIMRYR